MNCGSSALPRQRATKWGRRLHTALALVAAVSLPMLCAAPAFAMQSAAPAQVHPYAAHVSAASARFGIPERWIWNVMYVESRGRGGAVSTAGAMGLMQIMPGTWAMLTTRYRLGGDPFDTRANIMAGAAYLRLMWDRYGDIGLMLAAYNAGPGRADAYAAGRRRLPTETIAYVEKLAPALGAADGAAPSAAPRSAQISWRNAALFAQQPDSRNRPEGAQTKSATPTEHPLFVPLSGRSE